MGRQDWEDGSGSGGGSHAENEENTKSRSKKSGNDCDLGHEQFSRNCDTSQEQGVNGLGLWLIPEGVQRIPESQSLKA